MKTFLLTGALLFVALSAWGGGMMVPDCGDSGAYCHWDESQLSSGEKSEVCCPWDHQYCGKPHTDCPVGKCCNAPPRPV